MRNVRSALNRHRKDIGHLVDIVKDNDFKTSKAMPSSKMKSNLKKGLSRPTKHHPIIPNVELSQHFSAVLQRKAFASFHLVQNWILFGNLRLH
jgi:hypothetical protein